MTDFIGGVGNDTFTGTVDPDTFLTGGGKDSITGGAGNDTLTINAAVVGGSVFQGGDDIDTLIIQSFAATGTVYGPFVPTGRPISSVQLAGTATVGGFEKLAFQSAAAQDTQAIFSYAGVLGNQFAGITEVTGSDGYDSVVLLAVFSSAATPYSITAPTLTYNNWQAPDRPYLPADGVVVVVNTNIVINGTLTGSAHTGLQILGGGSGNDTIIGSDDMDRLSGGAGINSLSGGGGNDALVIGNTLSYSNGVLQTPVVFTGAGSLFDGGSGTDWLVLSGQINFQGTVSSIEGIWLSPAYGPATIPATGFVSVQQYTDVYMTSDTLAQFAADMELDGVGTLNISVADGATVDASAWTFTAGSVVKTAFQGGDGSELAISITGSSQGDSIEGALGNDSFTGGGGADSFSPGDGNDTITDFTDGVDRIDLSDSDIQSYAQLLELLAGSGGGIAQVGSDVVLSYTDDGVASTLTLQNFALANISADDFTFAPAPTGPVVIFGDADNEVLVGGAFNDTIYGDDGNDSLYGGDGDDLLSGDAGNNSISGGNGNDRLAAGLGSSTMTGGAGNDSFNVNDGDHIVTDFTDGEDRIDLVGSGIQTYAQLLEALAGSGGGMAQVGSDVVITFTDDGTTSTFTLQNVSLANISAADFAFDPLPSGAVIENGESSNDLITGGTFNDTLNGGDGNDTIYGNGGRDSLNGGNGNDVVKINAAITASSIYQGGNDIDTLVIQSLATPVTTYSPYAPDGVLQSNVQFLSFATVGGFEKLEFDSAADQVTQTVFSFAGLFGNQFTDFTEVTGGDGYDTLVLVAVFTSAATPYSITAPTLTYNNWLSPDRPYDPSDALVISVSGNIAINGTITGSAHTGLHILIGGIGNDTILGSDDMDRMSGSIGVNELHGGGGNDGLIIGNALSYNNGVLQTPVVVTGAGSLFDGGDGDDWLMVSGQVTFMGTVNSIEGIWLSPAYGPATIPATGFITVQPATDVVMDSDVLAQFVSDLELDGEGTLTIDALGGATVDASAWTFTAGAAIATAFTAEDATGDVTIIGSSQGDSISGGDYSDVLTGGSGADSFNPSDGNDTITDFTDGEDVIDLSDSGLLNFTQFLEYIAANGSMVQDGSDVVINYQDEGVPASLRILNIDLADVTADDIRFSALSTFSLNLFGDTSDEVLNGGTANDTIQGGDGNDTIYGNGGTDNLQGGIGNDVFVVDTATTANLNGGDGTDTLAIRVAAGSPATPWASSAASYVFVNPISVENLDFQTEAGQAGAAIFIRNVGGSLVLPAPTVIDGGDGADAAIFIAVNGMGAVPEILMPTVTVSNWTSATKPYLANSSDVLILLGSSNPSATYNYNLRANDTNGAAGIIQTLLGGAGNDTLTGSVGSDVLGYGGGADSLFGGDGNDVLTIVNGTTTTFNGATPVTGTLTGAGSQFKGGAGIDFLSVGGVVNFQGTLGGMEGIHLQSATSLNNASYGSQAAAELTISAATLLAMGNDVIFDGEGKVIVNAAAGATLNLSPSYVFEPGSNVRFVVNGSTGDEKLFGTNVVDTLSGAEGNDSLVGRFGADWLDGGDGNDTLIGGSGSAPLGSPGDGEDSLFGGAGTDLLYGGDGNDSVEGGNDGDTLFGGAGIDVLNGDDGDDVIDGGNDADAINGGAGADTLKGGLGNDTLLGGDGNDRFEIAANSGTDSIDGGLDSDSVVATAINLTLRLSGLSGVEEISANGFTGFKIAGTTLGDVLDFSGTVLTDVVNIDGGSGNDSLTGSAGADNLLGSMGTDILNGHDGADIIDGGADADTINGGAGADTIRGGTGDDSLSGDGDNDVFEIAFNSGTDFIDGGDGTDSVNATAINLTLRLSGIENVETITSNGFTGFKIAGTTLDDALDFSGVTLTGVVNIDGGTGNDSLTGSAGADSLIGNSGNDTVNGGDGADIITGGIGNDSLNGGNGADTITGGTNRDVMTGGADADRFAFTTKTDSGKLANSDLITDFTDGVDKIDLKLIDPNSVLAGDQAYVFNGSGAFLVNGTAQVRVISTGGGTNTLIQLDHDGSGTSDMEIILSGAHSLIAADFIL